MVSLLNLLIHILEQIRDWLEAGGALPDIPELKTELSIVEYKFNPSGKIILEPKEKIKERTGASPDLADSLALTFARPVYLPAGGRLEEDDSQEYDALANY